MKKAIFTVVVCFLICATANAQYVGSKKSDKYHIQECRWAKRISESNLVTFASVAEATHAEYQPCKVCKPPKAENSEATNKPSTRKVEKQSNTQNDGRCQAITKKGTRCKRRAKDGSRYCWQHQKS